MGRSNARRASCAHQAARADSLHLRKPALQRLPSALNLPHWPAQHERTTPHARRLRGRALALPPACVLWTTTCREIFLSKHRLELFTDAVLAIILTLMVL